jgi:hypothetical protein
MTPNGTTLPRAYRHAGVLVVPEFQKKPLSNCNCIVLIAESKHPYLNGGPYWVPIHNCAMFPVQLSWNDLISTLENPEGI